ncbi:MAG: DegT/DnrJ/EryC1/StrS family aminotransferase, partial [Candidatus Omnitrophica bacterium]|nr:DegT/DnrJ/EryC1/StrS family aminotransferase [Candidatus Omnitrophota bacterium]
MGNLAINGGKPVREKPWPLHTTIGKEELDAVTRVIEGKNLSLYEGNYFADEPFSFLGGPYVNALEKKWADYYGIKHAVAVNSATSGLYAAIGALGIGPGDEVIVSPYTMSASATCALVYNAIPVFADIEPDMFNLDPKSIEERISERTKAIVVIHIMGHPADMDSIMEIAKKHDIAVVEDCAQAHDAVYKGRKVGTIGDIGVFSLNVNKTIEVGEGGVLTTNDDDLALRLQLIRNHGEVVVDQMEYQDLNNMIGYNYRMCEVEASMAIEQLKKLKDFNSVRRELADYLNKELSRFDGITVPKEKEECTHVYYVYGMKFDEEKVGVSRDVFCKALCAEGIPVFQGYMKPLYLQELYQKRIGYGGKGCPFQCHHYDGEVSYEKGICPVAEKMYEKQYFGFEYLKAPNTLEDMKDVVMAFKK